jgi:hypothetical protein
VSLFQKAERRFVRFKAGIVGPSGSGKTLGALALASGLGQKIALVDTENGSASLYADRFAFDTASMAPPYLVAKYTRAIKEAEAAGYDVLILDSITHEWAGTGGLLEQKEAVEASGKNGFAAWAKLTPQHEAFKSAILNADLHILATIRAKQAYALTENEKGKVVPKKMGLAPIQREGLEYELTTVFELAMDHTASVSKDRTGLFDGRFFQLTPEIGAEVLAWLGSAKPATSETEGEA